MAKVRKVGLSQLSSDEVIKYASSNQKPPVKILNRRRYMMSGLVYVGQIIQNTYTY